MSFLRKGKKKDKGKKNKKSGKGKKNLCNMILKEGKLDVVRSKKESISFPLSFVVIAYKGFSPSSKFQHLVGASARDCIGVHRTVDWPRNVRERRKNFTNKRGWMVANYFYHRNERSFTLPSYSMAIRLRNNVSHTVIVLFVLVMSSRSIISFLFFFPFLV